MLGRLLSHGWRCLLGKDNPATTRSRLDLAKEWVLLTCLLMLLCLALTVTRLLYRVDLAFFDLVPQVVHCAATKPLAVVVVDDQTIARLGAWPFSRGVRVRMLDRLTDSGVTAIGIDLASLRQANPERADGAAAGGTASTRTSFQGAGQDQANTHCAYAASRRYGMPYERYSYINVLEGKVPPSRLSDRPVLIRSSAGDAGLRPAGHAGDALSLESLAGPGRDNGTQVTFAIPRPIGLAYELLFNELVVSLACLMLYRLTPRSGLLASLCLSLAIAAIAAALLHFADRLLPPSTGMLVCAVACLLWGWRRQEALLHFIVLLADRMAAEPLLPAKPRKIVQPTDPVQRQLSKTVDLDEQVRIYRELVDEWMDSLPEATLIASMEGTVLLANERLSALSGESDMNPTSRTTPAGRSVSEVLFQITASHRANEFAEQALALLNRWAQGEDLSAQTKSQLGQGIEISNARGGLSLLIKCAPIRPASYGEGALVFHLADVSSMRMAERQRDMALRFLSHDMRSPQASILALVSQAQRDPSRYTAQGFAELVSHYATRALSLSDDFLFLAKAENLPPKLALVDPALVLGDAVDDLLPQAGAKSTIVNLMAEPGLSTIADVQLLRRALVNLIGNAIKFGRESSTVDVELSATAQHVKIAVTDYGKGISERDQAKLFREFTQLDGSSSLSGHGLGLAFVKTVVDSLGGRLQVRSKLGEGTTFLMLLSRHEHDAAPGT